MTSEPGTNDYVADLMAKSVEAGLGGMQYAKTGQAIKKVVHPELICTPEELVETPEIVNQRIDALIDDVVSECGGNERMAVFNLMGMYGILAEMHLGQR